MVVGIIENFSNSSSSCICAILFLFADSLAIWNIPSPLYTVVIDTPAVINNTTIVTTRAIKVIAFSFLHLSIFSFSL